MGPEATMEKPFSRPGQRRLSLLASVAGPSAEHATSLEPVARKALLDLPKRSPRLSLFRFFVIFMGREDSPGSFRQRAHRCFVWPRAVADPRNSE